MKYYLLDASAFIYSIENLDKIKRNFFVEKTSGEAFLYLPQFCVTEILNTFARFFYQTKTIDAKKYQKWKNEFLNVIRGGKLIYCYDLHRYHNINTDKIFKTEHTMSVGKRGYLSSFDILIIAMGMELKKIHPKDDVIILSRDGRLLDITNSNPKFAKGEWQE